LFISKSENIVIESEALGSNVVAEYLDLNLVIQADRREIIDFVTRKNQPFRFPIVGIRDEIT
jgi:hypothetical protein